MYGILVFHYEINVSSTNYVERFVRRKISYSTI